MIKTLTLVLCLAAAPASMDKLVKELASEHYKERKSALLEAKKLDKAHLQKLIALLEKSSDPQLRLTAAELGAKKTAPANSIFALIKMDDLAALKKLSAENPRELGKSKKGISAADYARLLGKRKILAFLALKGFTSDIKLIEALVVADDSLSSLASDYNSTVDLIRLANPNLALKAGLIIRIPRKR